MEFKLGPGSDFKMERTGRLHSLSHAPGGLKTVTAAAGESHPFFCLYFWFLFCSLVRLEFFSCPGCASWWRFDCIDSRLFIFYFALLALCCPSGSSEAYYRFSRR